MTDLMDHMMWAYRGVLTQAGAGGGQIRLNFMSRDRVVFLYGMIGPDDYAADRNLEVWTTDNAGNIIARHIQVTPVDNEKVQMFKKGATVAAADEGFELEQLFVLGSGDILHIQVATPIQNETMTVAVRALIDAYIPIITTTDSVGTVTIAETYSKVI